MDTESVEDAMMDTSDPPPPPPQPPNNGGATPKAAPMTEAEQKERRASIKAIMADTSLTPVERRRSIQSLMDGRRRSSCGGSSVGGSGVGGSMAGAAATAAAAFDYASDHYASDTGDDFSDGGGMMPGGPDSPGSSLTGSGSRRGSLRDSLRGSFTLGFASLGMEGHDDATPGAAVVSDTSSYVGSMHLAAGSAIGNPRHMEKTRPECTHYKRNCTIISPCCGLAFGCRICHDDCPVLPPPIFQMQQEQEEQSAMAESSGGFDASDVAAAVGGGGAVSGSGGALLPKPKYARSSSMPTSFQEEETHHNIDRFAIEEVICRECFTRQSSKTNHCIKCGVQFGEYHCSICNLWMTDEEEPYHCPDCGFCRVGGRENFTHCHDCGMCIDALLFDDHNCKTGKYMSNCPVCQEDLFSSRSASHEMPCGHAIHWHCFRELTSFDTRCPVCKKTAETHDQMAPTWSAMAMGIALQPVPPDLARVVTIICNDCETRDEDRRWHFLGVQCRACTSFNTTVENTTLVGQEAATFLGDDMSTSSAPSGMGGGSAGGADASAMFGMTGGAGGSQGQAGGQMDALNMAQMQQQMNASTSRLAATSAMGANNDLDGSMRGDIRQRRGNFTFGLESELDQNMIESHGGGGGGGGDTTMADSDGPQQEQRGLGGRMRRLGRRSLPGRFWRNDSS